MSRSRRQTPIIGNAGDSDKEGKVAAHRVQRRSTRELLAAAVDELREDAAELDDLLLPDEHEVSDPWGWSKDGKHYLRRPETREKWMRK